MHGQAEIWLLAADNFDARLADVDEDQWDAPTGCGDWTVRELVDHTVFWQRNLAATVGADAGPDTDWTDLKAAITKADRYDPVFQRSQG